MSVKTWRFDAATFRELQSAGALYDAASADLRAFRDSGGKLILWQGFADPAAGPYGLPDYYQRLREAAGGLSAERHFARLFLIPGVYDCGGGYVAYEEDLLGALVNWVELDRAPDRSWRPLAETAPCAAARCSPTRRTTLPGPRRRE